MFSVVFMFISLIFCLVAANDEIQILRLNGTYFQDQPKGISEYLLCEGMSWKGKSQEYEVNKNRPSKIQLDEQSGMDFKCHDCMSGRLIRKETEFTIKVKASTKNTNKWICTIVRNSKSRYTIVEINEKPNRRDDEIRKPTMSSTNVATTYAEAATTSTTEQVDTQTNSILEEPDADDETSGSTMSTTSVATTYPEAATTSSTEKPLNVDINSILEEPDADDETSGSTMSTTSVATTYPEAATTSSTEKPLNVDINSSFEEPDANDESSGLTMSTTSVVTTYNEAATIATTEKPLNVEINPMNNKWIVVAATVPILAVLVCVLIVLYKRKKLNQHTLVSQRTPQNEYDYCVINPIPLNPEQVVYDYAVPEAPVSESVTDYYSKVIPKSQRKNKSELLVYAKPNTRDKFKADVRVDDYDNNTYAFPDQESIEKRNNSKSVHFNKKNAGKTDDSKSDNLYTSPVDKIKLDSEVAGYESINALHINSDRQSIHKRKHSESFQSNQKDSHKIDDLYADPVERIHGKSNLKSANYNQGKSDVPASDNKLLDIVYSEPLDKKETTDMDTYTNITDGPHYSNKIGGYCVYPTYSEPNVKSQ